MVFPAYTLFFIGLCGWIGWPQHPSSWDDQCILHPSTRLSPIPAKKHAYLSVSHISKPGQWEDFVDLPLEPQTLFSGEFAKQVDSKLLVVIFCITEGWPGDKASFSLVSMWVPNLVMCDGTPDPGLLNSWKSINLPLYLSHMFTSCNLQPELSRLHTNGYDKNIFQRLIRWLVYSSHQSLC